MEANMDRTGNSPIQGGKSNAAIDKTAATAHQTVDQIANAAAPAIDRLASTAHQTVERLARSAGPAAEWLEDSAQRLNESSTKMMSDAKQCVRDYPFVAVGAAFALGIVIGAVSRDRD